MSVLAGTAGIVLGAIFGTMFVFTCIISAIKAIRDRSRIKKRIVEKALTFKQEETNGKPDSSIEETQPHYSYTSNVVEVPSKSAGNFSVRGDRNRIAGRRQYECKGVTSRLSNGSDERLDLSVYSIETGVDNFNFRHSNTDMGYLRKLPPQKPINTPDIVPSQTSQKPKRTVSHESKINRNKNTSHLPEDCLAVRKMTRRHSYELAICENSWMPTNPMFGQQETEECGFRGGHSCHNRGKSSTVGFDNKAYNKV